LDVRRRIRSHLGLLRFVSLDASNRSDKNDRVATTPDRGRSDGKLVSTSNRYSPLSGVEAVNAGSACQLGTCTKKRTDG
jgi:hypothetical protein